MKVLWNNSNRHVDIGFYDIGGIIVRPQLMIPLGDLDDPEYYIERASKSSYLEVVDVEKVDNSDEAVEERVAAAKEKARINRNKTAKKLRDKKKLEMIRT
jgi:hypothetical protein